MGIPIDPIGIDAYIYIDFATLWADFFQIRCCPIAERLVRSLIGWTCGHAGDHGRTDKVCVGASQDRQNEICSHRLTPDGRNTDD